MNKKIYAALESFEREDGSLMPYNDEGIDIATAIENVFKDAKFNSHDYNIESELVFSSPSCDFGYVSIAWIESGRLYHDTYIYE